MPPTNKPAGKPAVGAKSDNQKSLVVTLRDGAGTIRQVRASRQKSGAYNIAVVDSVKGADGKKERSTGARSEVKDFAEATKRVDALVATSLKDGWRKSTVGTATSRADAFTADNLPKPKSAPAAS